MFRHEDSNKCKHDNYCDFVLCQYKHTTNDALIEEINEHEESNVPVIVCHGVVSQLQTRKKIWRHFSDVLSKDNIENG